MNSNGEFSSYPGRAEMLELIRQRDMQAAQQQTLEAGEQIPICLYQPSAQTTEQAIPTCISVL